MNGARFVHDRLELAGWQVEIADAQKVKGPAPLACKTDRIDARVLAELARRDLVVTASAGRLSAHDMRFELGDMLVSETAAPIWGYNAELE